MDDRVEWGRRRRHSGNEAKGQAEPERPSLSGGQQQRLCASRAASPVKPEVLLLGRAHVRAGSISTARIEELVERARSDYTIVIVTHNMQQAARVSQHRLHVSRRADRIYADCADFVKPRESALRTITGRFG